jgi:hypothetical protein
LTRYSSSALKEGRTSQHCLPHQAIIPLTKILNTPPSVCVIKDVFKLGSLWHNKETKENSHIFTDDK